MKKSIPCAAGADVDICLVDVSATYIQPCFQQLEKANAHGSARKLSGCPEKYNSPRNGEHVGSFTSLDVITPQHTPPADHNDDTGYRRHLLGRQRSNRGRWSPSQSPLNPDQYLPDPQAAGGFGQCEYHKVGIGFYSQLVVRMHMTFNCFLSKRNSRLFWKGVLILHHQAWSSPASVSSLKKTSLLTLVVKWLTRS